MDEQVTHDPILTRFRAALDEIYGARLERVVLFGSRARGEARPDSDYDVAVFLKSLPDRWTELDRLLPICASASLMILGLFRCHTSPRRRIPRPDAIDVRNPPRRIGPMTPQAARFVDKARQLLGEAETMLSVGLNDAAGRTAFLAAHNAGQA